MNESQYWHGRQSGDGDARDKELMAALNYQIERQEYNLFAMLKPSLTKDGDQWCVLYGDDLQSGIAGFGDTPYLAILDFNKAFVTK